MQYLDIENWNRKEHFNHFRTLADPTFGLVADVDVSSCYRQAKQQKDSFFVRYLHACMKAINAIDNFKYRIEGNKIAIHKVINVSATIARADTTFGFSFIDFSTDFEVFNANYQQEKKRVLSSDNLFPPKYSVACVHCSALPWVCFTSHKEPNSGNKNDSVPQFSFGKIKTVNNKKLMPVAINVNHALVDGYHVGQFFDKFQAELDKID
ncbi:CatA-like O-acetyltransferase [Tenacibaculum finnmarkense]|uniref:CatA-like O-acetyltransferase n=1 Tax=Tenacibaculum finnmarkense TaxID=2781243 RepID=UPI00187BBB5B|nr:CatA-like O-acetyltransferase [Tenacibaculum finnmarkense]MBE7647494.1 chloramphenicol acetyltransferase [Tenacibaculum finnmarkense genomovar ulcerans]MCD8409390.1 chloramphenicol acetyltransferase [Tenacibaculum finnmarkense genomovar ulcerans]MCD8422553.1 chloramphenicol acetyltransferase [Tenacibaculum finnmarkense genomovar ulcerans]MCG8237029.1 chloramphenicol acetyltransferase [Tenacibaculum finnmarkense genomovar ulcerans]MCG8238558.1 chloramphenicol acetyltransferase [Tenacibaculum